MANYTVTPGQSINTVFSTYDLGGEDVVELRASTPGGSANYSENVVVGSNDSGWGEGSLVTLGARDGDEITITSNAGTYAFSAPSINYLHTHDLTIIGGSVAAFRATGTGQRISDVTATSTETSAAGFYASAVLTSFSITNLSCKESSGKGGYFNAACTGTITDSNFNGNGNHGCHGNLGGIRFLGVEFAGNGGHGHWSAIASIVPQSLQNCVSHDNVATDLTYRHGFCFSPSSGTISNFSLDICKSYNVDIACDIQASSGNNTDGLITRSVFVGKGAGQTERGHGLFLGANNASFSNSSINVYSNTIGTEDALGAAIFVGIYNNPNIKLRNNILFNSSGGNVYTSSAGAPFLDSDYNIFWSTKEKPFSIAGVDYTFEEYKTLSGKDAHSRFADPKFVSTSDYHLQPTSPCIGAGTAIAGITTDIEGNPLSPPYNIGPYGIAAGELVSAPVGKDGPPRNNITRLTGASPIISPTDTYKLADTQAARDATGFVYGVDHWAFTSAGIPKEILGSVLIANGVGPQFFCGTRYIAGYSEPQTGSTLDRIKKVAGVE